MPAVPSSLASAPLDPYLDWAARNDFRHQRVGEWLPVLVQFDDIPPEGEAGGTALTSFVSLKWLDPAFKDAVRVPGIFLRPPQVIANSKDFNFCVLLVQKKAASPVTRSAGWRSRVRSMSFSSPFSLPTPPSKPPPTRSIDPPTPPVDPAPLSSSSRIAEFFRRLFGSRSGPTIRRQTGMLSLGVPVTNAVSSQRGGRESASPPTNPGPSADASVSLPRRVAVAVLEEGIAFVHERFRSPAGPRFEYLWDQNATVGTPPLPQLFGNELTASKIKVERALHPVGPVGEELTYRGTGRLDYRTDGFKAIARRRSHGAHVSSIACKTAPGIGPGLRPVIGVELPESGVADPVGSNLYAYIALGIVYALLRVQEQVSGQAPLPLVCNISYGPHTGPHDGTDDLEMLIDWLVDRSRETQWPLEVVLAAGNFRQARVHAACDIAAGTHQVLAWRVQPEDRLPNFVELWFPVEAIDQITVTVTSPLGVARSVSLSNQPDNGEKNTKGQDVFWMWFKPWAPWSLRAAVVIAVQPSASDPPLDLSQPTAPSGVWKIDVTANVDVSIEAWINRKIGASHRRARGRQSYFDDAAYVRFDPNTRPVKYDPIVPTSYVRRTSTLSGIATGAHTHVVGAVCRSTGAPTLYSSMGPTSGGARIEPDPTVLAAADDSLVMRGVLAAGTRSGSIVAMNGTSVAAPHYAHWLAEAIATAPTVGPPYVLPVVPPGPPPPPAAAVGKGCLVYPTGWYQVSRADRPTL